MQLLFSVILLSALASVYAKTILVKHNREVLPLNPQGGNLEDAFRKYLVAENILGNGENYVSDWATMETFVRQFNDFLASQDDGNIATFDMDAILEKDAFSNENGESENMTEIMIQKKFLEKGRPLSDNQSSLHLFGSRYDVRSKTTVGVFLHQDVAMIDHLPLERFSVKQGSENHQSELPYTDFECLYSETHEDQSCQTDRTCHFSNIYYYRGRWIIHADGFNVHQAERDKLPDIDGLSIGSYTWVAHSKHSNATLDERSNLNYTGKLMLLSNLKNGLLQLSPRAFFYSTEFTPGVEGNELKFLRKCKKECLGVSVVSEPVMLLHRVEPQTFGHVLVDAVYSSMWSMDELGVNDNEIDRMKVVLADPFEISSNDRLFGIMNDDITRNGEPLCQEGTVCLIKNAFLGVGCKGIFFSPRKYLQRKKSLDRTRKRMIEKMGQSREISSFCQVKVTLVLRTEAEGRYFSKFEVSELIRMVDERFGVPVNTVYMQDFPIEEQLRLLHDTTILIAVDGSVLDLVPVMRDSTAVITIVPPRRQYGHWRLFQSLSSKDPNVCEGGTKNKSFYVINAPLGRFSSVLSSTCLTLFSEATKSPGSAGISQVYIPVEAVLFTIEGILMQQQTEYNQEKCHSWWYYKSEVFVPHKERNVYWQNEFDFFISSQNVPSLCPSWYPVTLNRDGVLKMLQQKFNYQYILEIGCTGSSAGRFTADKVESFICVDPLTGKGNYRVTSDKYFESYPESRFDLIFVDGLHTSTQAMRDIINSLAHLIPGGVIAVHDTNPRHRIESESTYYGTSSWNGDVWRAIFHLNENYNSVLDIATLPFDWGITLIKLKEKDINMKINEDEYRNIEYKMLLERREETLNIISLCELEQFFK